MEFIQNIHSYDDLTSTLEKLLLDWARPEGWAVSPLAVNKPHFFICCSNIVGLAIC